MLVLFKIENVREKIGILRTGSLAIVNVHMVIYIKIQERTGGNNNYGIWIL